MYLDAVIDISARNGKNLNFVQAKADGILGVVHKATTGISNFDPLFEENRQKALDAGLYWGAYHVGTGGNGAAQANFFYEKAFHNRPAGEINETLCALDYRIEGPHRRMNLDEARAFVQTNHDGAHRGRYPCFYSGRLIKDELGNQPPDALLSKCPLWIVQHGVQSPTNIPPTWATWNLWQYEDATESERPVPHPVAGIGKCGRDQFFVDDPILLGIFWVGSA